MWVCVGVIVWVRKGVCGWNSLDCFLKVHVCTCRCVGGRGSVCVCVGGGGVRVRKGVCGWDSLHCCCRVCVRRGRGRGGGGVCVCVCDCVGVTV